MSAGTFQREVWAIASQDQTILSLLPTFKGDPAIFRGSVAPRDCPFPFAIVRPDVRSGDGGTFRRRGGSVLVDLGIYDDLANGEDVAEQIASRIEDIFDRQFIQPPGWRNSPISEVSRLSAPYEDGRTGIVVSIRIDATRE